LGRRSRDFLGDPGRDELGDERVEPVGGAVPFASEVEVPLGQDPQHDPMVGGLHGRQARRSERGDGDRAGVVGVVLVRPSRTEKPHPRRQRRRHVDDVLAGVDELLGEEVAEPAG
jgi:hypothetical protein